MDKDRIKLLQTELSEKDTITGAEIRDILDIALAMVRDRCISDINKNGVKYGPLEQILVSTKEVIVGFEDFVKHEVIQ